MAQQPVPGIMRLVSPPAATSRSSNAMRSSTDSELASLLVPNTASPTFWLSSHLQWRIQRAVSGLRSFLNGVTTGDSTPVLRWVMAQGSLFDSDFSAGTSVSVKGRARRRTLIDLRQVAHELHLALRAAVEGRGQRRLGHAPGLDLGSEALAVVLRLVAEEPPLLAAPAVTPVARDAVGDQGIVGPRVD